MLCGRTWVLMRNSHGGIWIEADTPGVLPKVTDELRCRGIYSMVEEKYIESLQSCELCGGPFQKVPESNYWEFCKARNFARISLASANCDSEFPTMFKPFHLKSEILR